MEQSDKIQSMFTETGDIDTEVDGMTTAQRKRYVKMTADLKERDKQQAICPWCLHRGTLKEFSRTNIRHEILKMTRCPDCGTNLRELSTRIVENLGPFGYSEWFWDNIYTWHGYEKVGGDGSKESWSKLSGRVKDMGFQETFWAVQRAKKGRGDATAYEDHSKSFSKKKGMPTVGDYDKKEIERQQRIRDTIRINKLKRARGEFVVDDP